MRTRNFLATALLALMPAAAHAAEGSLRGSPASMVRQHNIALEENLDFNRTPDAVLKEFEAGTLTHLPGNEDYRTANVSYPYAVPEVRMLIERVARDYRAACGEQLVVTSLTRPQTKQPRNAHKLSVHPAGLAVDLRISKSAACRAWLEQSLLTLENEGVLDITRERKPPHYHVAVFATQYRAYVERQDLAQRVAAERALAEARAAARPKLAAHTRGVTSASIVAPWLFLTTAGLTTMGALTRRLRRR